MDLDIIIPQKMTSVESKIITISMIYANNYDCLDELHDSSLVVDLAFLPAQIWLQQYRYAFLEGIIMFAYDLVV